MQSAPEVPLLSRSLLQLVTLRFLVTHIWPIHVGTVPGTVSDPVTSFFRPL